LAKVHTDKEFDDLMAAAFEESVVPYIEAVASTIEGRADGRAWHDFELVTARAILLSYLLGLSQVIEDAEIAGADFFSDKATYAKPGCGANAEGGGGFQPGNTCSGDGDGKAEPGESRHKTSTPEFKAWFGDSKVVDDDGEPLVVYHGTKKTFDEFKPRPGMDEMYFFSVDPLFASNWIQGSGGFMREPSQEVRDKKKEMRTYEDEIFNELGIENIDLSSEEGLKKYDEMRKEVGRRMTSRYGFDSYLEFESMADIRVIPVHLSAQNPFDPRKHKDLISWKSKAMEEAANRGNWVAYEQEEVIQQIKGMGFDGIWLSESGSEGSSLDTIAVFKPTQIKSSIGNTGEFDPDNPKITHAKETYAKEDWPMEVGFEEFAPEPFQEAIDLFEDRVPMLAHNVPHIAAIAKQQAADIAMAERMGVVAKLDAQTNAISKSLGHGFWVSDLKGTKEEKKTITINMQDMIAQAMRGVMPDDRMTLPEFISRAWLEGAQNLTAARLETIYRTNLQSAFNEGHMSSMRSPEVKSVAPLAMIVEIQDPRSRDHHAAMDGYINTVEYFDRLQLAPPNGFNCRGTVRVVSWTEAENLGLVGDDGEINWKALERYNGNRQGYIDRGEYPDPGFTNSVQAA